jgi:hypothetical protein
VSIDTDLFPADVEIEEKVRAAKSSFDRGDFIIASFLSPFVG